MVRRLFEGGAGTFDVEYRLRASQRPLDLAARSGGGGPEGHGTTYVYGLYSDISDRKQAEEIRTCC
jgi:hypothetical protein